MRILVAGDSWGCGEWGKDVKNRSTITHPGTAGFLSKHHHVLNISAPGISNNDSYVLIKSVLQHEKFDLIVWFQTDPFRDLRPYHNNETFLNMKSYEDMLVTQKNLLQRIYVKLDKLDVKILCLGGVSSLSCDDIAQTKNLVPLIVRITEMLCPGYHHPDIWTDEWLRYIDKIFYDHSFNKDLDKLLGDQSYLEGLCSNPGYAYYFLPDCMHPNRHAHRLIADAILSHLNL